MIYRSIGKYMVKGHGHCHAEVEDSCQIEAVNFINDYFPRYRRRLSDPCILSLVQQLLDSGFELGLRLLRR